MDWKEFQFNKSMDDMNTNNLRALSKSVISYRNGVDIKLDTWRIEKLIKQLGFGDDLTLDNLVESEISNFTFDNLDNLNHKKRELKN